VAAGVPTIWMGILDALNKEPARWSLKRGLRMVVGGSAAPEGLIRGLDQHGLNVIHAWGMTETSPLGSVCRLGPEAEWMSENERYAVRAKQGQPGPFVEVRAVSERGEVPWDGRSHGELEVRGPWIAASYFDMPDARDRWSADGWFRTGDVVTIDPRGYIQISDRTKDLIKSGGEWISSVELENALMGHPSVKEAAVVAAPHPKWSERPVAVVVLRADTKVTIDELRAFLAPLFAKWWLPDAVVFVEQIPRTSAGKFLKSELRKRFEHWSWDEQGERA
jgi:fatty-acyl-CoA synthase